MNISEIFNVLAQDKYFISALILSLAFVLVILLLYYARKHFYQKISKKQVLSPKYLMKFETPIIMLGVVLAAEVVLNRIVNEKNQITITIANINETLLIIAFTYIVVIIADLILENWSSRLRKLRETRTHEEIIPLLRSVKNILISIVALLLILQAWGVQITGIAASIGVVGVILGFVYKDTLSNIFSGISLIWDDSFKKGDLIELQDGEIGFINEINLRSTKIRNFNSEEVIIPNSLLANMKIKNYAHPTKSIRITVNFSVVYGSEPEKVHKVIMDLLKSKKEILPYPLPRIFFLEMAEYSLKFSALFYIKDYQKMYKIRSDMTKEIYNALRKNNLKIPFPTRTVYYEKK